MKMLVPRKRDIDGNEVLSHADREQRMTYAERRAREYPPLADQLDAIWKGGEEMERMRQLVMAVKQRFPKEDDDSPSS